MWYWFPYHQGDGVLRYMADDAVGHRLYVILADKPEDEFGIRFECWQPVKDQSWAGRYAYWKDIERQNTRAQFLEEYPHLAQYLVPGKMELKDIG